MGGAKIGRIFLLRVENLPRHLGIGICGGHLRDQRAQPPQPFVGLVLRLRIQPQQLRHVFGSEIAAGAQTAMRWTKYSLNNWLRLAGPSFDASLALEMLGFTGPEVQEGIASHREKRKPSFPPPPREM